MSAASTMALRVRRNGRVGDLAREILAVLEKPAKALSKTGQPLEDAVLEDLAREERNDTHARAHFERHVAAVIAMELVAVEAFLVIPEARAAEAVHRVHDGDEVLEEFRGDVFVRLVLARKLERHGEHRRAIERHPRRPVRLLEAASAGKRLGAVEHTDIVESKEAPGEELVPFEVLAIHPPREVDEELLEDALEKEPVPAPARPGHLVDPPASPRVHGRVHVA